MRLKQLRCAGPILVLLASMLPGICAGIESETAVGSVTCTYGCADTENPGQYRIRTQRSLSCEQTVPFCFHVFCSIDAFEAISMAASGCPDGTSGDSSGIECEALPAHHQVDLMSKAVCYREAGCLQELQARRETYETLCATESFQFSPVTWKTEKKYACQPTASPSPNPSASPSPSPQVDSAPTSHSSSSSSYGYDSSSSSSTSFGSNSSTSSSYESSSSTSYYSSSSSSPAY